MYKLKYNFQQYTQVINVYLENILKNSSEYFNNQNREGEVINIEKEKKVLLRCIENIEEYLYYYFKNFPNNFNTILNSIINNLRTIACLPENQRGIYGLTRAEKKIIYINPELRDSSTLTGENRTRLYMAHELGHIINNEWMNYVSEWLNRLRKHNNDVIPDTFQLFYDGFSMLDEATTQDRAEDFVYSFLGKRRPKYQRERNSMLFDGQEYESNFDYYGELQAPATMFARTLRGIGKEKNDGKALNLLSSRALSPDFARLIIDEYIKDEQAGSFFEELRYMGLLKRASYAKFGVGDASNCKNSAEYLSKFIHTTSQMRDWREPLININDER